MPLPGPDFVRAAEALATAQHPVEDYTRALYSIALYSDWFPLDIRLKGLTFTVRLIPGHIWGEPRANGPQAQADVMIISKMPGKDELRLGKNLVGVSGEILKDVLESHGCSRDSYDNWYITNILKFTHPAPHMGKGLATDWLKDCRPLLHMELRLVKPKYILCLGSEAGKELLGPRGAVNNSMGKVFDYEILLPDGTIHKAKVMTCIHTAAVAREPDLMPQLEKAIGLFVRLTNGEDVGAAEKDIQHVVAKTEAEALYWLDLMVNETSNGGIVAVDCEWQGEQPQEPGSWLRTIQVSHKAKFALCLVMRECGGAENLCKCPSVLARLKKLFHRPGIRAAGHFHRADLPWLLHYGLDITKQFEAPADPINGWELTKTEGGFDTGTAAHSVCETDDYKLEVLATRLTSCPRYDMALQEEKKALCKRLKIKQDDLPGYGDIPDEVIYPYACYDVDATRRLVDVYNGTGDRPGLLDCDDYGNNSRIAFWITSRAAPACLEMEQTGLCIDMKRAERLLDTYRLLKSRKIDELCKLIKWPHFNVNSHFDRRELLFGWKLRGQVNKETQEPVRSSPTDAILCNLEPIKSTAKINKSWQELMNSPDAHTYMASTDKEVLGILFHQESNTFNGKILSLLRDVCFIGQLLKTTLKPPTLTKEGEDETDEDGNRIYEKGLLSYVCSDNRIRTHIFQTLETGRYASARPNLQNISKKREADYKRILGDQYLYPLRSIFIAAPGHVLIEADYVGAELAGMAWMSGDPTMIDHVRRAQLPEDHSDYYDIHSSVAVAAFRLNCPATKKGLASIGMLHLRVAAKNVIFGYAYGRGAEAICRQAKEEGVDISVADAQTLIDGLVAQYPLLPMFFSECGERTFSPMFMFNCFGRARRFHTATDNKTRGEQRRQAMNFPIQSLVADAVSRGLDHLYTRRSMYGLNYKIALQIHDAVLLEVPCEEAEAVYNKVLPECMVDLVPIRPANLDGVPLGTEYRLGIDREVYLEWGEKLYESDKARHWGVPARFMKKRK